MPNLRFHPILTRILKQLDFSKLSSKLIQNTDSLYSSNNHKGYRGDTIFEGIKNSKYWISLNIIEGYDSLFLHTNLKPKENFKFINYEGIIQNFDKPNYCYLIKIDELRLDIQSLRLIIENDIFPYF